MKDVYTHFRAASTLTKLLESQFKVGKHSFGLDPLLGFIPGLGDLFSVVLSFYIIWIGIRVGLPADKIASMIGNIVYDFLIGFIPLLGDIADFAFKANTRNLKILEEFMPEKIYEGKYSLNI